MTTLLASLLMLGIGPVIYTQIRHRSRVLAILDLLIIASIIGLIGFEILPETVNSAGWLVLSAVAIGALVPQALEHVLHRTDLHAIENWTHRLTLAAGISGLALHAMLDGVAIGTAEGATGMDTLLSLAVVLHRLPVGLTVWWLLRPTFGSRLATGVLCIMAIATVLGFFAGGGLETYFTGIAGRWFQAFVAGSLLHVVFFRKHLDHG